MQLSRQAPNTPFRLVLTIAAAAVLATPVVTHADPPGREHGHGDDHRRGHYKYESHYDHRAGRGYNRWMRPGVAVPALPRGYYTLHAPHREYYVHGGHFYERAHRGFVVVRPPIGVVVATLPFGYLALSIGGSHYFFSGGIYFRPAPSGYIVVPPPYPTAAASATIVVQANALNVRLGPGLDYGVVGVVSGGIELPVYGSAPDWYYVRTPNGTYGWVMMNFTVPLNAPQG